MKKLTMLLAVLMIVGSVTGWCGMNGVVDTVIEVPKNSDIHMVEDTGHLLHMANEGIEKTYTAITDPMEPGLKHVRTLRDETMKHTKMILNKTWDLLTFRSMRDKK